MTKGQIIIIDDSVFVRNYLSNMITSVPHLELVHTASNGIIGFQQIQLSHPDIVILDLEMDEGNGLYVLQQIEENMSFSERPFVLIHSSRAKYGDPMFKKAIEFGFCDFILKIEGPITELDSKLRSAFLPKILLGIEAKKTRELLNNSPFVRSTGTTKSIDSNNNIDTSKKDEQTLITPEGLKYLPQILAKKTIKPKLLILAASTGGPQVIREIVTSLDNTISIPVVIIQHMPETFTLSFARELEQASGFPTHELKHNMYLEKGHLYVFPGGMHGKLSAFGNLFVYYTDRKDYTNHPFKPSINLAIEYLLNSSHHHFIYAILSGMGSDGAAGAKKLHKQGSLVFAQNRDSSVVWGMPGSAVREGAVDLILDQNDIGIGIQKALTYYKI